MINHNIKTDCIEELDEAFDRLTTLRSKDIESISIQIDELNVGEVSVKGIRMNLAALTRILLSISLIAIFLFLLFYL